MAMPQNRLASALPCCDSNHKPIGRAAVTRLFRRGVASVAASRRIGRQARPGPIGLREGEDIGVKVHLVVQELPSSFADVAKDPQTGTDQEISIEGLAKMVNWLTRSDSPDHLMPKNGSAQVDARANRGQERPGRVINPSDRLITTPPAPSRGEPLSYCGAAAVRTGRAQGLNSTLISIRRGRGFSRAVLRG